MAGVRLRWLDMTASAQAVSLTAAGLLATGLWVTATMPAAAQASWSMYDQYSTSYSIPFVSAPDYTQDRTNITVSAIVTASGKNSGAITFEIDTGSVGVALPAYDLGINVSSSQTLYYASSGITAYGEWVSASVAYNAATPLVDGSVPTASVQVFVVAQVVVNGQGYDCSPSSSSLNPNCFRMMGVGYGRPSQGDTPAVTPAQNPLLHLQGMDMTSASAPVRAGYVIGPDGIQAGLTSQNAGSGFAYVQLAPASNNGVQDWQTLPGQIYVNNTQATRDTSVLLDTGISYLWSGFGHAPTASCAADASMTCIADGQQMRVAFGVAGTPYQISYSYVSGSNASPLAPWFSRLNELPGEINTGIHPLAGFVYAFDAVGGYVGLRAIDPGASGVAFTASLATLGTMTLPQAFDTNLPVYVSAATTLVPADTATFSGAVSGPGTLAVDGPGAVLLSGSVSLPGLSVASGTLNVSGSVSAPVSIAAGGTFQSSGTLAGTVENAGTFRNAGSMTGDLTNSGSAGNTGLLGGAVSNSGTLANSGTILGTLFNSSTGSVENSGLLTGNVTNAGLLQNLGTGIPVSATNTGGVLQVTSPISLPGVTILPGTVVLQPASTPSLTSASSLMSAPSLMSTSSLMSAPPTATIQGDVTNSGLFLNSGEVSGALVNSSLAVNTGTITGAGTNSGIYINSGTHNGTVTNSGTFNNSGTVAGAVANSGTLSNDGTISGSVSNAGLLVGTGLIGGDLVSFGRISPGHSLGTVTVSGDALLASGSVHVAEIGAPGQSDQLIVGGALVSQGATLQIIPLAGTAPQLNSSYVLMTAGGGITGSFVLDMTGFGSQASLYPFLGAQVTSSGGALDLTMVRSAVPFSALAITPNQRALATAADGLPEAAAITAALAELPGTAAAPAFTALDGEVYAASLSALQSQAATVRHAVTGRLLQVAGGPVASGARAGDMPGLSGATLWGQAFAGWGSLDGTFNAAGYSTTSGGFLMGLDAMAGDWRVGLAAGFSQSALTLDGGASSLDADTYDLALYAGRSFGPLALRLGAAMAWQDLSSSRLISLPTFLGTESAGYGGSTAQVFGEAGWDVPVNGFGVPAALQPFAGLSYVSVSTDAFTESAGAAALSGASGSFGVLSSTLGVRGSLVARAGSVPVTLAGGIGWQHAYGDLTPAATLAFVAGGTPFTVSGAPLASDSLLLSAGIAAQVAANLSLAASYSGQIAATASENAVKGSFVLNF